MFFYNEVERYSEPIEILNKVSCEYRPTLMNRNDLSFLCGLIKKYSPQKLVEVGIAYGGTTAVIAECLSKLDNECEMHSIDILNSFAGMEPGDYFNSVKKYINMNKISHSFHLGNPAPFFLDEIGDNIDFLILDTSHGLPGELLEFITFLPYLTENAVVVLHDVVDHCTWKDNLGFEYATQLLFDCVVSDKILIEDNSRAADYPNIAAFKVNSDTRKYIGNCFGAMNMTWLYMPDDEQYNMYMDNIKKHYDKAYYEILEKAKQINKVYFIRMFNNIKDDLYTLYNNNTYIYGAGNIGHECHKLLSKIGVNDCGFVVSDNQSITQNNDNIYHISDNVDISKMYIIAVGPHLQKEMIENLESLGITKYIIFDDFKKKYGGI